MKNGFQSVELVGKFSVVLANFTRVGKKAAPRCADITGVDEAQLFSTGVPPCVAR